MKQNLLKIAAAVALSLGGVAHADPVQIQFWNAMGGELGQTVQHLVDEFNASQPDYKVVSVNKGTYKDTMVAAIAAYRAGSAPDIVQVFDVGTATMMAADHATIPVYELMAQQKLPFATSSFIPAAASYYANAKGQLVSMPFNASTPVLFYNKDMLDKAGVKPPRTWQEMDAVGRKLVAKGAQCGFTTGWPDWIQFEEFSLWNGVPFATQNNGYGGQRGVHLLVNSKPFVDHLSRLAQWSTDGVFKYGGPESNSRPLFISQQCAMYIDSSASYAAVKGGAQFGFGIAPLPYDAKLKSAPQNTVVGGASLWVMRGAPASHQAGVARFLAFLASAPSQAYWARKTGYVPVTKAGFALLQKQGFYTEQPGAKVAVDELSHRRPLAYTMGVRLGYMPQLRDLERSAMENVINGKQGAQAALDGVVADGDKLLQEFADNNGN